jgi:hypothetical protein
MRIIRPTIAVGIVLLALTACVPTAAAPTPTATSGASTPTPSTTATPPPEIDVTAATVVVTATTTSVLGTDGSTLASVNYEMDGAVAAGQLAEALGTAPVEAVIPEMGGGPCPEARSYDFGGLMLRSPGSMWTPSSFEVIVTTASTSDGVEIETVAGQRIGVAQPDFEAAVGDVMVLYETDTILGFDLINPEAGPYDRIGVYAEFAGGRLDYFAAPTLLGFVGSCA